MALIDDYRNIDPNTIEALGNLQRIINSYGEAVNSPEYKLLIDKGFADQRIDLAAANIAKSQGISFDDAKKSILNNPEWVDKITRNNIINEIAYQNQALYSNAPHIKDALYNVKSLLDENQRENLADFLEEANASYLSRILSGPSRIADTDTWKNMSDMAQLVYLNEFVKKFKENPEEAKKILQGHSGRQGVQAWEGDLIGFNQRQKPETKRIEEKPKEEIVATPDATPKQSEEEIKEQAKQDRIQNLALQLANLKAASTPSSIKDLSSYTPKWWGAV